ncbi:MAG: VOC family protein [Comamonadaceae bacterium]|nr:MAG: VOC family protein [Comamonadaceae bacterium]
MAKLRHIALSVPDPEASAEFYRQAFGLEIVGKANSATATGVYLSDGTVSLALLKYRTDAPAGPRGKDYVGLHHMGFIVDDLAEQSARVEQAGATLFQDVPDAHSTEYYEKKYTDKDGIIFDITHSGWRGAKA